MKKIVFISFIFLTACRTTQVASTNNNTTNPNITVNGKIFTTLFQQRAAEYRALCFQAYNIAKLRVDEYKSVTNKPKAIITDIDETVLDNSPYEAFQTLQGKDYDPASWYQWTAKGIADTMPGAASFLKYASSKGITIFYITNRDEKERASTIGNLKKFQLPNADDAHFLPKQSISSKEARRRTVSLTHEIVLLMGDNLADFSSLFDKKTVEDRINNTDFSAGEFGNRFIVLPNPVYGDWESSLFNYNYKLTAAQKDSVVRGALKAY
ncbi:MAG: 5'-nucleotidase, lipoprotein e(P4) family [Ferruginibacter sp.]